MTTAVVEKDITPTDAIRESMRRWDMHPNAVHLLIIHALLQAVDDAHRVAQDRPLDGGKHTDQNMFRGKLSNWTNDSRFEFWVEMANIDSGSAREALIDIAEGRRDVEWKTTKD